MKTLKSLILVGLFAITANANLIPGAATSKKEAGTILTVNEADRSDKMIYLNKVDTSKLFFSFIPKTRECEVLEDTGGAKNWIEDKTHECKVMTHKVLKSGIVVDCKINGVPRIYAFGKNYGDCLLSGKTALFTVQQDNKRRGVEQWKQF